MIAEPAGWRRDRGRPPLAEVFGSIATRPTGSLGRKLMAFLGPGYLVAVGYMDPGQLGDLARRRLQVRLRAAYRRAALQPDGDPAAGACARGSASASGRDLAQACRDAFPRSVSWPLWVLAEIAICATDLAEVIGTAIGLNLLFHIPLEIGVIMTALDVFLDPLDAESRLPLRGGLRRHAARRDCRLLCDADCAWQIPTGAR